MSDPRERDSGNTILAKEFPGGVLVATGANSSVGLRSMPARYLLMDEVDAYPPSASTGAAGTEEGDPVDLAIRRTGTFANRQIAMVSTPTIAEVSRIEQAYQESDQRKYYVPCPHCGAFQVLRWAQVKWPDRKPAEAWYECERCHERIADHHKPEMLARGRVARGSGRRRRDGGLLAERAVLAVDHVGTTGEGLPPRPQVAGADADVHEHGPGRDVPAGRHDEDRR